MFYNYINLNVTKRNQKLALSMMFVMLINVICKQCGRQFAPMWHPNTFAVSGFEIDATCSQLFVTYCCRLFKLHDEIQTLRLNKLPEK